MRPLILVLVLATACGSNEKQDEPCDMSDDKVAAIYKQLQGYEPHPECVRRPAAFPQLAYAGGFANDAGCVDVVQIWKCKRSSTKDLPAILQAAGWNTTDDAGRERIAKDWFAIDDDLMWTANAVQLEHFAKAGKTFTPPKLTHGAGKLGLDGWFETGNVTILGYMPSYEHRSIEIGADGSMSPGKTTDSFDHIRE